MKRTQRRSGKGAGTADPFRSAPQNHPRKPKIPPILLEGDDPSVPPGTGTGQKFGLGPVSAAPTQAAGTLPPAYGTERLMLLPRDPRTLYAHWDLTLLQQREYSTRSVDGHLVLRTYVEGLMGPPASEIPLAPGARHLFVSVPAPGTRYRAELGYYSRKDDWVSISVSETVATPAQTVSQDKTARFVTLTGRQRPSNITSSPLTRLASTRPPTIPPRVGWVPALGIEPACPPTENTISPEPVESVEPAAEWSTVREHGLSDVLGWQFHFAPSSMEFAIPEAEAFQASSPSGAEAAPREFGLKVDADLMVYGATEPSAEVRVAGERIELRPDGTFSFRLALPDGQHEVKIVGTSEEGQVRSATLKAERQTKSG